MTIDAGIVGWAVLVHQATIGTDTTDTVQSIVTVFSAQAFGKTSATDARFSTPTIRVPVTVLDAESVGAKFSGITNVVSIAFGAQEA